MNFEFNFRLNTFIWFPSHQGKNIRPIRIGIENVGNMAVYWGGHAYINEKQLKRKSYKIQDYILIKTIYSWEKKIFFTRVHNAITFFSRVALVSRWCRSCHACAARVWHLVVKLTKFFTDLTLRDLGNRYSQKQSPEVFYKKIYVNMQQVYGKTVMWNYDFRRKAKQFYWNYTFTCVLL